MENRSRPKRDRAHLHDMNIMERAGSPANSSYERTLPVERRAPGSLVTHRMCSGLSVGSLLTTVTGRSTDFGCLSSERSQELFTVHSLDVEKKHARLHATNAIDIILRFENWINRNLIHLAYLYVQ